jgi:hypothetical protein
MSGTGTPAYFASSSVIRKKSFISWTQDQPGKEPQSPKGVAAIINRVAKKQDSFDAGGPK